MSKQPRLAGRGASLRRPLQAVVGMALLVCAGVFAAESGQPEILRICVAEGYLPPLTVLQGESRVQQHIRAAAAQADWPVVFVPRPWRRCLAEVAEGQLHAIVGAAPAAVNLRTLAFPMKDGGLDAARSIAEVRVVAFRPMGGYADWDGEQFHGLEGPVLHISEGVFMAEALERLGVSSDAGRRPEQLMEMLLAGRSNLAADIEGRVLNLLQRDEFRGRFEVLPEPFVHTLAFTAMNKAFYAANREKVERFWTALGRLQRPYRAE